MAFLVPKFSLQNYTSVMGKEYQGSTGWWSLVDIVRLLCVSGFVARFALLDARRLATDVSVGSQETVLLGGKSVNLKECIIAIKLLMPTLRCARYFFRDIGGGTHLGIDLMLPKGTPITAFCGGRISRIKTRDGVTKNEGNCVVVQDARGYFWGYEHLDRVDVRVGQQVAAGTQVGTCGKTGHATQYHLHLQVDLPKTTPNPHRSTTLATIQKKTVDPLRPLRAVFSSVQDLPYEAQYQDAIGVLLEKGYIQSTSGSVFPNNSLQRYEMALFTHRILKKIGQYAHLKKVTTTTPAYTDIAPGQAELTEALVSLRQYGLMKGTTPQTFSPAGLLLFEQALAVLGRAFYKLSDAPGTTRYQSYLTYFTRQGYLQGLPASVGKPLLRKDLFLLVSRMGV